MGNPLGRLLPIIVLAAACGPPPGERITIIDTRSACRLDVGKREARCPCTTNDDLAELPDRPELEALRLHAIEPLDLGRLARLGHLRALFVEALEPPDIEGLERARQIRHLVIPLPSGGLSSLARLTQLESLTILRLEDAHKRPPIPPVDLTPLSALRELRELDLTALDVRDVTPLADLPKLEKLAVYPAKDVHLAALDRLESLVLTDSCGSVRYARHTDGALAPWLERLETHGREGDCLTPICSIDPGACPSSPDCNARKKQRPE